MTSRSEAPSSEMDFCWGKCLFPFLLIATRGKEEILAVRGRIASLLPVVNTSKKKQSTSAGTLGSLLLPEVMVLQILGARSRWLFIRSHWKLKPYSSFTASKLARTAMVNPFLPEFSTSRCYNRRLVDVYTRTK